MSELFIPFLKESDNLPMYRKLFRGFQHAILHGELATGSKLPASRSLANSLGVSRNTVKNAYELLLAEGYIVTRHGSGSYVADNLVTIAANRNKTPDVAEDSTTAIQLSAFAGHFSGIKSLPRNRSSELLSPTQPSLKHFPWLAWKHSLSVAARKMKLNSERSAGGQQELREQIASYLRVTRGVRCTPDQVMICSGSQHALFFCFSMLLNSDDSVLVENPGYQGSHGILSALGARTVPVATDSSGFCLDTGLTQEPDARGILITPSRNYPMGHTMSLERRTTLLQWAQSKERWIIEDDYDSEFRFDGPPLTALQGMGGENNVIYLGTFSRIFHPAIRIGYMVLPESLVQPFTAARDYMDGGVSLLPQLAMADFIGSGQFARHIRKTRKLYQSRREQLLSAMADAFGDTLEPVNSDGGMHSVFLLPDDFSDIEICRQAHQQGLGIRPLSPHYLGDSKKNGLIIGFAGFSQDDIELGITKLAQIVT